MNYINWVSYRYLTSTKGRFLTFLNFISIAGIAIGVMSLIVVTGVMTGFGNNLRDKIIGTTPHIVVEKELGIQDYNKVIAQLEKIEGVEGASAFAQGNIFLEIGGQAKGLVMRGIEPSSEHKVTKTEQYIVKGSLGDLNEDGVIVGSELARYFGLTIGDSITFIAPGSGVSGGDWRYLLNVVGIFKSGMVDYDSNLVICHLKKSQEMFNLPPETTMGIGVKLTDPYQAAEVSKSIFKVLGYSFLLKTWIDMNRSLFEALYLEKWGLFIILTLMILIASFNIISTLIVTVTSKVQDIGILKAVGVPSRAVRRIFTNLGMYIGSLGTFWGLVLGISISYILKTYVSVPEQIYSIDHVPVDLQITDMFITVIAAMLITYVATIYPAAKAAQLQPVDAIRYE